MRTRKSSNANNSNNHLLTPNNTLLPIIARSKMICPQQEYILTALLPGMEAFMSSNHQGMCQTRPIKTMKWKASPTHTQDIPLLVELEGQQFRRIPVSWNKFTMKIITDMQINTPMMSLSRTNLKPRLPSLLLIGGFLLLGMKWFQWVLQANASWQGLWGTPTYRLKSYR